LEGVVDPIEQVSIDLFDALVPDSDSFQDYEWRVPRPEIVCVGEATHTYQP
jgi:hypothetical protein